MKKLIFSGFILFSLLGNQRILGQGPLPGDQLSNPQNTQCGSPVSGNLSGYTPDNVPPCGVPPTGPGRFYVFNASVTGTATLNLCGSNNSVNVGVYTQLMNCVGSSNNPNYCSTSGVVQFPILASNLYIIHVHGTGFFNMFLTCAPPINTGPMTLTMPSCLYNYIGYTPFDSPISVLSVAVSGGQAPYHFEWTEITDNTTNLVNESDENQNHSDAVILSPTQTTTYSLVVTDALGSTSTGSTQIVVLDVSCDKAGGKGSKGKEKTVQICHAPPSKPGKGKTKCVSESQAQKTLARTNSKRTQYYLGPCDNANQVQCAPVARKRNGYRGHRGPSIPDSITPGGVKTKIGDLKVAVIDCVYVIDEKGDTIERLKKGGVIVKFEPVNGISLDSAARANGQHHFNWYQIVVSETNCNQAKDKSGNPIPSAPPAYVDPPPGGYSGKSDDSLPWYMDERKPPGGGKSEREANDGRFSDFPNDRPGCVIVFKCWLVSLNADNSFHSWHKGFTWTWTKNADGSSTVSGEAALPGPPGAGEYGGAMTGGFNGSGPGKWFEYVTGAEAPTFNLIAYPNPFDDETVLNLRLPVSQHASLEIYNSFGKRIATLLDDEVEGGIDYSFKLNSSELESGVYLYRLVSPDYQKTGKIICVH